MDRLSLIQRNLAFFYRGDPAFAGESFQGEREVSHTAVDDEADGSGEEGNTQWDHVNILLVGSGGIGCEILHLLALSGFQSNITVIDMDLIELSNLNRQFLFREEHIGMPKSKIAAEHINSRFSNFHVKYECDRVENMSDDFYRQFDLVMLALDSVPARLWMNRKIAELAQWEVVEHTDVVDGKHVCKQQYEITEAIPLIDTGTESYRGHCNVVVMNDSPSEDEDGNSCVRRTKTCCLQCCGLDSFDKTGENMNVPMCTLENIPRNPQHCVLYVRYKLWGSLRKVTIDGELQEEPLDLDNEDHVNWIAEKSEERRKQFNIPMMVENSCGVIDYFFTLGVLKNVTPAVSFINGLIASLAVQEAMKLLTGIADKKSLLCPSSNEVENSLILTHNVSNYNGNTLNTNDGFFFNTMRLGYDSAYMNCSVCGPRPVLVLGSDCTSNLQVSDFRRLLAELLPGHTSAIMEKSVSVRFHGVVVDMSPRDNNITIKNLFEKSGQSDFLGEWEHHNRDGGNEVKAYVFFYGSDTEGSLWVPVLWD